MKVESLVHHRFGIRQRHIEELELGEYLTAVVGVTISLDVNNLGPASVEKQHQPGVRAHCAMHTGQGLDPSVGRNEMQRSVYKHNIKLPFHAQTKQILPDRLDRQ